MVILCVDLVHLQHLHNCLDTGSSTVVENQRPKSPVPEISLRVFLFYLLLFIIFY